MIFENDFFTRGPVFDTCYNRISMTKRRNRRTDEHLETILFIKLNNTLLGKVFEDGILTFD